MKSKKKVPKKIKNKPKVKEGINRILTIGEIDFVISINLSQKDLMQYEIDFGKFEGKVSDLKQFEEKKDLWAKFRLNSNSDYLNTLLFMAQTSKTENFIDFIPISFNKFDDELVAEIVKYVTCLNGLFINESEICEGGNCSITFVIMYNEQIREIKIGGATEANPNNNTQQENSEPPKEDKKDPPTEEKKEEPKKNNDEKNSEKPPQSESEQSNSTVAKLPIRNEDSPFNNIQLTCNRYNLFYIDFNTITSFPSPSLKMDDFVDLLVFLQGHYCTVIVKFSKSAAEIEMEDLNNIFFYTDIFIFSYKESIGIFDAHYKKFTNDNPIKSIDEKKVFDYFTVGIATSGGIGIYTKKSKVGLFLEDFVKFTVIEVSGKSQEKFTHDCQPYPKVNHSNIKVVENYKKIVKSNYDSLSAVFYGCFIGKICENLGKFAGQAILYPAYLIGFEVLKRAVEILYNGLSIYDEKTLTKVKIPKEKVEEFLNKNAMDSKEGKFVLDCVNKSKSSMKEYMPLYDYHLNNFFSAGSVRKDLKNKGFINTKGFIMYDPVYRSVLGSEHMRLKSRSKSREKKEADKELVHSIQKLSISNNIKMKETDVKSKVAKSNLTMDKKLPRVNHGSPKRGSPGKNKK